MATGCAGAAGDAAPWDLVLYISGASPHSTAAVETVRRLCDTELPADSRLTVIDVQTEPTLAAQDRVLAVPALVLRSPVPGRKLVGDMTDPDRVRRWIGLAGPATDQQPTGQRSGGA